MKNSQLRLIVSPPSWRLSNETRTIGLRGLAQARAALQATPAPENPLSPATEAA